MSSEPTFAATAHDEVWALEVSCEEILAMDAKLARLKADYLALSRWAGQQNAGNAFATQVRLSADARIAEWDQPLEEWEP